MQQTLGRQQLRREFQRRGPWTTRFRVGEDVVGGFYHAEGDARLQQFLRLYPQPGRVLELGALEGGHTFPIARRARHVVAVEARNGNLERARWLQSFFAADNITFVQNDLDRCDVRELGEFDVVLNMGLLYHLTEPWLLLRRLAQCAGAMFLWTHVAPDKGKLVERCGYRGQLYEEQGPHDPLSGMSAHSFWPTRDELLRMLGDAGFRDCTILQEEPRHSDGPAVLLNCRSARFPQAVGAAPPDATIPAG